ncbi:MAG: response regulator transcription factor [Candidatus Dormibacteraeota bacterium]|nr:response regulator transcription factor [Candidatus Dormibacteraeota bacterium]MBO0745629.1 response regulator transcription factor [Candidatus Dormibacteraeota bacterium]
MISVLLADDQVMIRSGLRALLSAEADIDVVGEAGDGVEALESARRLGPDVVVMDIRMPVMDGVEATRRLAADPDLERTRVLVLTTYDDDELVFQALRAGAGGFLLKDADPEDLVAGVRVLASGDALLAPSITRRLVEAFVARPEPALAPPSMMEPLTSREQEIVALVGTGLSNHEIAGRLFISPATARTHVSRAMGKIGARDRAQVVVFAYESGLVVPTRRRE